MVLVENFKQSKSFMALYFSCLAKVEPMLLTFKSLCFLRRT